MEFAKHYFLLCLISTIMLGQNTQLIAQTTNTANPTLDDHCFINEDGTIERHEMARFKKMLRSNKDSVLYAIRSESFEDLVAHTIPGINTYRYSSYYRYTQVGNFFSPDKKHAVMLYLSDAFETGDDDFRADLYIFEITPEGIHQELYIPKLSSYYREIAADIGDLDQDGNQELIVLTSEPEWGSTTKPSNEYYHRFLYDKEKNSFIRYKGFEQLANAIYLDPQHLYTYQACGCDGDCWVSTLYEQRNNTLYPIATLEDQCVGMGSLYVINNNAKHLTSEVLIANRSDIPAFWQRYSRDDSAQK
jgi:hypothetical protein